MLAKILSGALNGIITYIVILIIVLVLNAVHLPEVATIIAPFAWAIALIVGVLTALGVIPSYWRDPIK